jgi:hypothetical protein
VETIAVVDKLLARGQENGYFAIGGHILFGVLVFCLLVSFE